MLLVPVYLAPSSIDGVGIFARHPIAAGTCVWRFAPGFDQRYTREEFLALPDAAQRFLAKYSYRSKVSGLYVLDNDLARHINHADDPNVRSVAEDGEPEMLSIAARDITAGEEITEDYSLYEDATDPDNLRFLLEPELLPDDVDPRRHSKT